MILMIDRENDTQTGWILDDIAKISIGKTKRMTRSLLEELIQKDYHDILIMDNMFNGAAAANPKDIIEDDLLDCMVLVCRKTDGEEFSILFDTVAYLCNNEGRTIRRIVV